MRRLLPGLLRGRNPLDKEAAKPLFPYIKDCVQCGHCEIYCPTKALKLVPDYDSYMFPREVVTTHIR